MDTLSLVLPSASTLGMCEATLLFLLVVQRRQRAWMARRGKRADERALGLRVMSVHLLAALQAHERLRAMGGEHAEAPSDQAALRKFLGLGNQIERMLVEVWMQLSKRAADPLELIEKMEGLGNGAVAAFCDVLLARSPFDVDLHYRVALAFEERGLLTRARDILGRVVVFDPSFRDASERIQALKAQIAATPETSELSASAALPSTAYVLVGKPATPQPAPSSCPAAAVAVERSPARSAPPTPSPDVAPVTPLPLAKIDLTKTAPPKPAAPLAPSQRADQNFRAAIVAIAEKLEHVSHFELLGITEAATAEDVDRAFQAVVRRFHPERLAGSGLGEFAPIARRILARATEASAVLNDPKRRAAYVASRAADGSTKIANLDVLQAEMTLRKSQAFLEQGKYDAAIEALSGAIEQNSNEPLYRAHLAWARFVRPGASKDLVAAEALSELETVLRQSPQFARGYFWLGQVQKHFQKADKAARAFQKALELDPTLFDAERELRLIQLRRARP